MGGRLGLDHLEPAVPALASYHHLLRGQRLDLADEELLQTLGHGDDVLPRLVVDVTVGEHLVEVLDALLRLPVVVVVKSLPDRAQIHRLLDDLEVVWESELDGVHREVEGPGVVMLPHGLHDAAPEDGELVGVAAAAAGWRLERRLEHSIDRSNLHLRPDRGLAGVPASSIELVNKSFYSLHQVCTKQKCSRSHLGSTPTSPPRLITFMWP